LKRRAATRAAIAFIFVALAGAARTARAQMIEPPRPPTEAPQPAPAELDASKLSKVPKLKKFVEAEYPKEAIDKGISADVVLLISITA